MSDENLDNIVDFSGERVRRVHDQNEKRLQAVRAAFAKALPLTSTRSKANKEIEEKTLIESGQQRWCDSSLG